MVRNFFRPIWMINRTNPRLIWTPTCGDIRQIAKHTSNPPLEKIPPPFEICKESLTFVSRCMTTRRECCHFRGQVPCYFSKNSRRFILNSLVLHARQLVRLKTFFIDIARSEIKLRSIQLFVKISTEVLENSSFRR